MSFLRSLLIAVIGGLLYGACFAPFRLQWLAWIVLAPLVVVMRAQPTAGRAALLGAAAALAGNYLTVHWLPHTITVYYQQPQPWGFAIFAAVSLAMVVPWLSAFGAATWLLSRRPGPFLPLSVAAAWVAVELARSTFLTGNPWVLLGYSQIGVDSVVQIADLAGVYGISFVLATSGAAVAELYLALRRRQAFDTRLAIAVGSALVLSAATYAYGRLRLAGADRADSTPASVGLVQGNLDLGSQWRQELYGRNLDVYMRLTHEVLSRERVDLVIWPEAAMTFFVADEPLYRAALGRLLQPFQSELLSGGPYAVEKAGPFYNSAYLLAANGDILARYDKEKLLPFAEYFPFGTGILRRNFGRVRQFTAVPTPALLPTAIGRAGVLICNEAMFPEIARRRVRAGAEILVNLSNDTWVGDEQFSAIAFATSLLRAVEQRRYLIRVSTSGPSAIIDPWGRRLVETAIAKRATAIGAVRPRSDRTIYSRVGDTFALACLLFLAIAVTSALLRRRPARPPWNLELGISNSRRRPRARGLRRYATTTSVGRTSRGDG